MIGDKKVIFSGIQPSGIITLGNYIGAVKNWSALQDEYACIYSVVDMHAITVRQSPADLRRRSLETLAIIIACGVDPEKSLLFIQSHVPQHAQLAWALNCYTMFGELSRMTQFKDKSQRHADNINAGLFDYPVLMAADILLYQADLVPVGVDQKQHLELARNIAERFNGLYSPTFVVPEGYIPPLGAKVMSLTDPTKKMSKSDENPKSYVSIIDDEATIIKKFKSAVTDSDMEIAFKEGKDGINNLLTIYSAVTGKTIAEAEKEFAGQGYGAFKQAVGEAVAAHLKPIRETYNDLLNNKDYLEKIYKSSAEQASAIAERTLRKVY
ncbi:MAG: tryptophan--tRNA ligase, partial [Clostridia bacterium]|nr:tryptophan--tRNA ligase [Clostridia bacterium]